MTESKPRLSIGLPVFNGEKYLRQALDSVITQTYRDFELIISDNASTDKTQQICLEYTKRDNRIRYYRSKKNNGAAWNFNNVFKLSLGEYFKWISHDDMMAPNLVSRCMSAIERDPSIVLCHPKYALINEFDEVVGQLDLGTVTDSQKPHERFVDLLFRKAFPWMLFGIFRRNALAKTPLFGDYIGSDWNLLAEISLIGRILEIPEPLFFRREPPDSYTKRFYSEKISITNRRTELGWWTGNRASPRFVLPIWKNCLEFFRSVNRVELSFSEKLLCYTKILLWIRRIGRHLMKQDLVNAFQLWRFELCYGKIKSKS